jgi:G:T-mismatch repair DNA endonuclease (very short patch repair protein)
MNIAEYNLDKSTNWNIAEYQQRVDRRIRTVFVDNKPLVHRDKIKFTCLGCNKLTTIKAKYFVDRDGEKFCRECAISAYHERHPDWLILSDEQKKQISKRNSKLKITKTATRICPTCNKKFKVRLTAKRKYQKYDTRECCIRGWSKHNQPTQPELIFRDILDKNNINFQMYKYLKIDNKIHVFDFWLPDKNILIEVDGDYWHYNKNLPRVVKKPPTKYQLIRIARDVEKNDYCQKNGVKLIRILESELVDRANVVVGELLER